MATILFLCTGNSCRSIGAEATFNHLSPEGWSEMSQDSRKPWGHRSGAAYLAVTFCILSSLACSPSDAPAGTAPTSPPPMALLDQTTQLGIHFVHENGGSGNLHFIEPVGAGAAAFDYDQDGDIDLLLRQSGALPENDSTTTRLNDRLYRNELIPTGVLRFVDVTEQVQLHTRGYGMGVAVGDVDNNGFPDLLLTNYGPDQLWLNLDGKTFEEVGERAGVNDDRWTTSATFFDYDKDGRLDLYVAGYVDYFPDVEQPCRTLGGAPNYCGPNAFRPVSDRLYRNLGNGRFDNTTLASGIATEAGAGLGVVATDVNGDDWIDVFVANDQQANTLWINHRDGTFTNRGFFSGVALNAEGQPEASMGIAVGDLDNDGLADRFLAHLARQTNTLLHNLGDGLFQDQTVQAELGSPSWRHTAFGTATVDLDLDGWLDVVVANGAVVLEEAAALAGDYRALGQPNQVFRNQGNGRFTEVSVAAASSLGLREVSRGLLRADLDNDGRPDLLITNNHGPARVLINRSQPAPPESREWFGLRLLTGGRDAYGAVVRFGAAAEQPGLARTVAADGSYLCAQDPRVTITLPKDQTPFFVWVHWLSGQDEKFSLQPSGYQTLREGQGGPRSQ